MRAKFRPTGPQAIYRCAKRKPFEQPADPHPGQMYALNPALAQWAFNLTRNTPLEDSDQLEGDSQRL